MNLRSVARFTGAIKALTGLMIATASFVAAAQNTPYKDFGDIRVHYSAFNSSFLSPEIASTYDISRGADKGLVNIAVVKEGDSTGSTAVVAGEATNILGQQQVLDFFEVREGDAVYYLAPFEFEHEDPMTFKVRVQTSRDKQPLNVRFQRTFYHDEGP